MSGDAWDWRRRHQVVAWLIWGVAGATVVPASVASDVFNVNAAVPMSPASGLLSAAADCAPHVLPARLDIQDAVEIALCTNGRTREAWANIKVQAAALGVSRSAYLPKLDGTVEAHLAHQSTAVAEHPELSSAVHQRADTQTLALSWVLADFGRRSADVRGGQQQLAAALAGHASALLDVFTDVSHAYYDAQASTSSVATAAEIEATAAASYDAAAGRAKQGVAPISDALQAKTALFEATLLREKAEGDLMLAQGVLAAHMGIDPGNSLALPKIDDDIAAAPLAESVADLIQQAQANHPHIRQAEAQLNVASAKVDQARAEYLPTLALKVSASHNSTPVSASLGAPELPAQAHDRRVGLELNIPFFDGFGRDYRTKQAKGQVEVEQARLDTARQQVAGDVWATYFALRTAAKTFEQSAGLLDVAESSYAAANERYRVGVGSIVDLLNAQTALSSARKRRLQAAADWRAAELGLSARLGVVDLERTR